MDPARNLPHSGDITANGTLHSHGLRMMTKDDEIKRMVVMNDDESHGGGVIRTLNPKTLNS